MIGNIPCNFNRCTLSFKYQCNTLTLQKNISSWIRKTNSRDRSVSAKLKLQLPTSKIHPFKADSAKLILSEPSLVIVRQLEMLNVLLGYEQCNRYKIMSAGGSPLGFIIEERGSMGNWIIRQLLGTHRPLKAYVLNNQGEQLLKIERPFFFINSRIEISAIGGSNTNSERIIGEVHQTWHLWRRRYNLFKDYKQFGEIDSGFLSWNFDCVNGFRQVLANIGRDFAGFAREIFTDTGHYVIRWEPQSLADLSYNRTLEISSSKLSLDERAVVLACAVSIDFDYFSKLSNNSSLFPLFAVLFSEVI